tara:strand:+ start:260 stop:673 length:414 start_codon:yes stop_codon:yes gene_type:complete
MTVSDEYGSKRALRPKAIRENKSPDASAMEVAEHHDVLLGAPGTGKCYNLHGFTAGTTSTADGGFGGCLSGLDGSGVNPGFLVTRHGPISCKFPMPVAYPENSAIAFSVHGQAAGVPTGGATKNIMFLLYTVEDIRV